MKISEVIKKLQEIKKEYGYVDSLPPYLKFLTGGFIPLEDSGASFDRFNEGKNIVYIGW